MKTLRRIKRIIIAVIGVPLLLFGIILIPIPGPGLLVSFIALMILSLEFSWAEKPYLKAKQGLKSIIDKSMEKYREEKNRE